jgi:hypothetical protein
MNDKAPKDEKNTDKGQHGEVTVMVNNHPVLLSAHRVTGHEVKAAAIAQGVEIQADFLLTLEAHEGQEARIISDDETLTVNKHSVFSANDGDDDSQ